MQKIFNTAHYYHIVIILRHSQIVPLCINNTLMDKFFCYRNSPSLRVSPARNNTDTLKFTPASGPGIDEAYTLKPGAIGPRNLMSVSGSTEFFRLWSIILSSIQVFAEAANN